MKTCPDCAEQIQSAARVCRFCGLRLDGSLAGEPPASQRPPSPHSSTPPPTAPPTPLDAAPALTRSPDSGRLAVSKALLAGGGLVLILIVGAFVLLATGSRDPEAEPAPDGLTAPVGASTGTLLSSPSAIAAFDADAKELARTAQTAMETYATDNSGRYAGADAASLAAIESSLDTETLTVVASASEYSVSVRSVSGTSFAITRSGGAVSFPCDLPGSGGCSSSGDWS